VPLSALTPTTPPDSAALYDEAQRLAARVDTLTSGSLADQLEAVDLRRHAAALYAKSGARRDAAIPAGPSSAAAGENS
jgi:hypothetical protein